MFQALNAYLRALDDILRDEYGKSAWRQESRRHGTGKNRKKQDRQKTEEKHSNLSPKMPAPVPKMPHPRRTTGRLAGGLLGILFLGTTYAEGTHEGRGVGEPTRIII
jgi:hypothetical protein